MRTVRSQLSKLLLTGLSLAVFWAGSCLPDETISAQTERPNVIVIITDDQGYGDIAAHGNPVLQTPHLDELYRNSVRLTNYHVDPTCSPTRSALMTGRFSTRTGVWHTIMGRSILDPNELTLAEVFRANGYRTGMFGKWHLGDNFPSRPQDQGFEHVVWHHGGGVGQGPDYWDNDYFDDVYDVNGHWQPFEGYCTDIWFDQATEFIKSNRDQPFFVYLSTNAPHGPWNVSEKYSDRLAALGVPAALSRFYGMVENIDENVGKLQSFLNDHGLADNTLLIFTTDNGSAAPETGRREEYERFNAGMRGSKGSEYEGGHRVPFFASWPGGDLVANRDVDTLCAHIDVLPTLAELCQLKVPDGPQLDGVSLASALLDSQAPPLDRTLFVHSQRIEHPKKWRKSAVMTPRWRLVNQNELYDVTLDPSQQTDVAEMHPQVVRQLQADYDRWWTSLEPVFDDYVRIGLGGEESPVHLMSHDWHTEDRGTPWHQNHVRNGYIGNGPWAVEVLADGDYEITLYRWPSQANRAMECTNAGLRIGGHYEDHDLDPSDPKATFRVKLSAGPYMLQTTLRRQSGEEHGAYFAEVRRVD